MGELTLFIMRMAFLAILWIFVFVVVVALRSDLFGQRVRKLPATETVPSAAPPARTAPSAGGVIASRLVITAGAKEGLQIDLPEEVLTIGRSGDSGLVIRDDYTSTNHSRITRTENGWVLEDLDSTNGTVLSGKRISTPKLVPLNATITIGTTSFELRR